MTIQGASFGLFRTQFQTDPIESGLPVIEGLEGGVAEIGATVTVSGSGDIQWRLNGADINGATDTSLIVPANEGSTLSVALDGRASLPADIRHPEPVAEGNLTNQSFEQVTGVRTLDVSADFSFAGTPFYTLSNLISGVSIASATGIVSFDTDVLSLQSGTGVTVRCADAGAPNRFAQSQFNFSIVDTTAPVLSEATASANGSTGATGSVVTDEAGGQLFWVLTESATAPSVAQILAGQTQTGISAPASGTQTVVTTGVQPLSPAPTGLTAGTTYALHLVHEDVEGNRSTRLSSASFTTDGDLSFSFTEGATGEAELFADGNGQITITAPSIYAGTYTVNLAQLASGPLNLVPPVLLGGGSADIGDVLTARPGLWLYDSAGAAPVTSQIWQADNGSGFSNISGATGTSFTVTSAQGGDDLRIRETLNQSGTGIATADSAAVTVASAFALSFSEGATGEAELFADGDGQITITAPSIYAGTYTVNLAQLASGPLNLVPPVLLGGGSADIGDVLTARPGLWLYDSAGAAPVTSQIWQADDGSGFSNISGATGTSFTITSAQSGDDLRIRETLTQSGTGSNAANSNSTSVANSGGVGSLRGVTDTFLETEDATVMTLTGLNIGAANATRRVGALFAFRAFRTITGVTIGGVAATVDTVITGEVVQLAVAYANVPNGSLADLEVTFNNSAAGIAGAVFTFDTSDTFTAFPVIRDATSSVDLSNTVSASGAFLIGIVSGEDDNGNLAGWNWTGLSTEHLDDNFTGSTNPFNPASVASETNVPAGPRTIQATADTEADSGISVGLLVEVS